MGYKIQFTLLDVGGLGFDYKCTLILLIWYKKIYELCLIFINSSIRYFVYLKDFEHLMCFEFFKDCGSRVSEKGKGNRVVRHS